MGELIRMTEDSNIMRSYADKIMASGHSLLSMVDELIEYANSGKNPHENIPNDEE
jgi:hypothetical protein